MRTDGPVVVALDGTTHSALTLRWGVDEAVRRRARLLLVTVVEDSWQVTAWSWYPIIGTGDVDTVAKEYLADEANVVEEHHPGLHVETRVLHGQVVPCLRELSVSAQLLVLGARARTGRARTGSTGIHVAAHARCPVAVVRSDLAHPTPTTAAIVVGVDGSSASLAAAHLAAREAWMRGRPLLVVHARPTIPDPFGRGSVPPLETADENDPTHRAAHSLAAKVRDAHDGLSVELALVDDDPADALVTLGVGAALLVVGSRGLGSFRGMLLGSVGHAVLREATVPVIVVHDAG
ncbi:universal stress protein [Cellulomonas xylanilytica]|uniref:Universal stress protein n=1 Tax=Cellulomonas xylanilytica TaxID=233583 RepID=A0A510V4U1_9CELL|nr:universal stress protein [Cellulomonas xylanilytica]GEK20931.1 universal stress protein [Cellulomonas xylanilytica]